MKTLGPSNCVRAIPASVRCLFHISHFLFYTIPSNSLSNLNLLSFTAGRSLPRNTGLFPFTALVIKGFSINQRSIVLEMPKEQRILSTHRRSPFPAAQIRQSRSAEPHPGHRNTANWSAADDEVLVAARAAGLNWQSTASKHFPNKTANACRKRHERLVERRTHEDWNTKRLDVLAVEYMELRKEIWGPLAAKIGERWSVVEAKVSHQIKRSAYHH